MARICTNEFSKIYIYIYMETVTFQSQAQGSGSSSSSSSPLLFCFLVSRKSCLSLGLWMTALAFGLNQARSSLE